MPTYETCKICGKKSGSPMHTVKTHGMPFAEYKKKYKTGAIKAKGKGKAKAAKPKKPAASKAKKAPAKKKAGKKTAKPKAKPKATPAKKPKKLASRKSGLKEATKKSPPKKKAAPKKKALPEKVAEPKKEKAKRATKASFIDSEYAEMDKRMDDIQGHDEEKDRIKKLMKNPENIEMVRILYGRLTAELKESFFLKAIEDGVKAAAPIMVEGSKDEPPAEIHKFTVQIDKPETAEGEDQQVKMKLERGSCYMIEEEKPDKSYKIFTQIVNKGAVGLCITREFPQKIKNKYEITEETTMVWLSNSESEGAFKPVELGKLLYKIEKFLETHQNSLILFSGLEYLITQNNYSSVLKLIQLLNEQIAMRNSLLIMPVSPSALDKKEFKLIEREVEVLL
jgi:hypothetical protein